MGAGHATFKTAQVTGLNRFGALRLGSIAVSPEGHGDEDGTMIKSKNVCFMALTLGLFAGCAGAPDGTSEEMSEGGPEPVAKQGDDLFVALSQKWPWNEIKVCWENPAGVYTTQEGWVRDAIRTTWELESAVSFTEWDRCAAGDPGISAAIERLRLRFLRWRRSVPIPTGLGSVSARASSAVDGAAPRLLRFGARFSALTKFWDDRYSAAEFVYGTEPSDFLLEKCAVLPAGGEILCLADGEGRNGVFLASRGMRVTGVDSSLVGLTKAEKLAAERGVPYASIVADLSVWELGDSRWDGVVSIWAHLPAPIRSALHPRIARALRPGGVLLLEHYHPRQIGYGTGGPSDPTMMLTLAELDQAFSGWDHLHTFEGERVVIEGSGHGGKSYVTQAILRKPS